MNIPFMLLSGDASSSVAAKGGTLFAYIVAIGLVATVFYFFVVRPKEKEQKKRKEMLKTMEVGDVVMTTSYFYGVLIDITGDDVIVEFGSNKNCRIPMDKQAIAKVYKADKEN